MLLLPPSWPAELACCFYTLPASSFPPSPLPPLSQSLLSLFRLFSSANLFILRSLHSSCYLCSHLSVGPDYSSLLAEVTMVALPVPLRPHCSPLFQQAYFTGYDFASEVERPCTQRSEMSGPYQFVSFSAQQQADFDLFSAPYSPGYSPVPMTAYPSPALTNTVPIMHSPYQMDPECGMAASYGLGVARSVQWKPTGVPFPSPVSQVLPLASPPQFANGLPSPSPHQPPRQMPPAASAKPTPSKFVSPW